MQWLAHLVAHLGTPGAAANASRALADERAMAAEVDRFLLRFDHPAGQGETPVGPAASQRSQVA